MMRSLGDRSAVKCLVGLVGSVADLREMIAEARNRTWPAAVMPRLWPLEKGGLLVQPWEPDYKRHTVRVDKYRLQKDVLPVGAPFSRLWLNAGVCRPVRDPNSCIGSTTVSG